MTFYCRHGRKLKSAVLTCFLNDKDTSPLYDHRTCLREEAQSREARSRAMQEEARSRTMQEAQAEAQTRFARESIKALTAWKGHFDESVDDYPASFKHARTENLPIAVPRGHYAQHWGEGAKQTAQRESDQKKTARRKRSISP